MSDAPRERDSEAVRLNVAIDARLDSGQAGGVESVIVGLASGLSRLGTDQPERYHFLTYAEADAWLKPYVTGPCRILNVVRPAQSGRGLRDLLKSRAPFVHTAWHALPGLPGIGVNPPPASDGTVEAAGMDIVHFPIQAAFLTEVPSVYHPHDLQHLHLPQFFTPRLRAVRESHYREFCEQARLVVVTSRWMRDDIVRRYGLPPEKVAIVPWAPVVTEYAEPSETDLERVRKELRLPDRFILYPAQTWPHKNHLGLVRALDVLRRRGVRVSLVASGLQNAFFHEIDRAARDLGVDDQIRWVGFVSPLDLQALYRLTTAVVIPTLFEAASGPLWEAFAAGVPAACSNVTSLPEQAGDAALIFDPIDANEIADAVERLWSDDALRATLVARGRRNVSRYDWMHTARLFRAHYRRLAGLTLADDDLELLAGPSFL